MSLLPFCSTVLGFLTPWAYQRSFCQPIVESFLWLCASLVLPFHHLLSTWGATQCCHILDVSRLLTCTISGGRQCQVQQSSFESWLTLFRLLRLDIYTTASEKITNYIYTKVLLHRTALKVDHFTARFHTVNPRIMLISKVHSLAYYCTESQLPVYTILTGLNAPTNPRILLISKVHNLAYYCTESQLPVYTILTGLNAPTN